MHICTCTYSKLCIKYWAMHWYTYPSAKRRRYCHIVEAAIVTRVRGCTRCTVGRGARKCGCRGGMNGTLGWKSPRTTRGTWKSPIHRVLCEWVNEERGERKRVHVSVRGCRKEPYCTTEVNNQGSALTPQYVFTHNLILHMYTCIYALVLNWIINKKVQ